MIINKHIENLIKSLDVGIGGYTADILQTLWNNKDKHDFITICSIDKPTKDKNKKTDHLKVGIIYKGKFTDISYIIGLVSGNGTDVNNGAIPVNFNGIDVGYQLIENIYNKLIPNQSDLKAQKFHAVQSQYIF